jgi:tRNA pseudouridine38-40 synthase
LQRIALGVAYDGSPWQGWQTQPHRLTVQDTLEGALISFTGSFHATVCAGRTDTGVHATAQVVHLDTTIKRDLHAWVRGMNALLPQSIAIQWAQQVPDSFHARFSARERTYTYILINTPVRQPLCQARAGWVFQPLALQPMQEAAQFLIGEHDFSSFRSSQCQAASPVRTLSELSIQRKGSRIILRIKANAFLHHMVRNIVGALVQIGLGRKPVSFMTELLVAKDRRLGAPTFSPDGLYLTGVNYPDVLLPSTQDMNFDI